MIGPIETVKKIRRRRQRSTIHERRLDLSQKGEARQCNCAWPYADVGVVIAPFFK